MSFASPTVQRVSPTLPLAAMVDILFLTLIFFMTASALREEEGLIDVSLPSTESPQPSGYETRIVVTVMEDGTIRMGDSAYTLQELRQTLVALAAQYPDETVVIRGDKDSRLGLTVKIMDIAYHDAKLRNVFLATTKNPPEVE